jgi:hypothetical protein
MNHEQQVYEFLRDKLISRPDAIVMLMEMRYPAAEAECIVDEWIQCWEFQKDFDEEREQGWSV